MQTSLLPLSLYTNAILSKSINALSVKWSAYTFKTYLHLNETTYSKSLCFVHFYRHDFHRFNIVSSYCLALVSVYLLYCTVSSCIKASFCPIVDINECSALPSVCDVNNNCQNKVGSYLCTRKPGFVGNEKTCQGICKFYFKLHEAFTVTLQVVYYLKSTKIFDNENKEIENAGRFGHMKRA